jgi:hypothetical protein
LILENIHKYDYVIWIDADAFFYNDVGNIYTDIISKNINYSFIFSKDINNISINSGIFIVKNTSFSVDFLTKWAYDEELFINNPCPGHWEQGVLNDMYIKNIMDIQSTAILFDYGFLQHFSKDELIIFHKIPTLTLQNLTPRLRVAPSSVKKPYIFHLAGRDYNTRCTISKEYFYENIFSCKFLENRKYSWQNNCILFLAHFEMDAFGKGTYTQQDSYTDVTESNHDYTEFESTRKSDGEIVKGKIL